MIVWGGTDSPTQNTVVNTGGRYDPATDGWTPTSQGANLPAARAGHTAVWTGTAMIVWGGGSNAGGRYYPATDSWMPTSTGANVPTSRFGSTAVWTGREMIVWGGENSDGSTQYLSTGARYDPVADGWLPTSTGVNVLSGRRGHTGSWSGTQMIVWGGNVTSTSPGLYCACPSGLIVYRDADGDGYGDAAVSTPACDGSIPAGYALAASDCNDANSEVHPGAAETCDGLDDDCDGIVDNGGAPALCIDANPCTNDACDGAGGCSHVFNSAPCDDGVLCTNDDTCSAGSCAGVVGPPQEIHGVSVAGRAPTMLNWVGPGGGTLYDLATSSLAGLGATGTAGATCLGNDVDGTTFEDPQTDPAAGDGYYYLIRAQSVCGTGNYGSDSAGVERVPTSACP
jgi:hypothetical protein